MLVLYSSTAVLPSQFVFFILVYLKIQKQPPGGVLRRGGCVLGVCSKFAGERSCRNAISIKLQGNFVEITLLYGCSAVDSLHSFRTLFHGNSSRWLLLKFMLPVHFHTTYCLQELQSNNLFRICFHFQNLWAVDVNWLCKL